MNRSSRLIRKRRNWWAISRTMAVSGARKAGRNWSEFMILSIPNSAAPFHTASMTSPTMSDGLAWAPIMTPPALRSMRFADGATRWERTHIPPRPPGASKWNKIEHRLFSFITMNGRGKPLRSYRTIVQLIAATTTDTGLKVRAELDEKKTPKGLKVTAAHLAAVNISRHSFHGDWNYTISPCRKTRARLIAK